MYTHCMNEWKYLPKQETIKRLEKRMSARYIAWLQKKLEEKKR